MWVWVRRVRVRVRVRDRVWVWFHPLLPVEMDGHVRVQTVGDGVKTDLF